MLTRLLPSLLLVLLASPAHAAWLPLTPDADPEAPATLRVLSSSAEATVLELRVTGVHQETVRLDGHRYTAVSIGDGVETRPGKPAVPFVSRFLAVPRGASPRVEVLAVERQPLEGVVVPPAQIPAKRCGQQPRARFVCDLDLYQGEAGFPARQVEVAERGVFRDLEYARVRLNPVRFEPAAGRVVVATRLVVRLSHAGSVGTYLAQAGVSPTFQNLYQGLFLNHEAVMAFDTAAPTRERVLIITPDDLEASVAPLVAWKRQVGFEVDVLPLSEAGPSASGIKATLQARYDDPAARPTFVLLVGDVQEMPTNTGTGGCASDFMYTQLAGGDLVSDVILSRISAHDGAQLAHQIDKSIDYERDMPVGALSDWISGSVCVSSSEGEGGSNDDLRSDILCGLQEDYGYAPTDKLYHSQGNDSAVNISAAIDEGRGWVTYLGHGSGTGWETTNPSYMNSHINKLVNVDRLPVIMDVSCSNGGFDVYDTCFAEAWMRASDGDEATGAVGIYSSSTPAAWDEPAEMAIGVVKGLTEDGVFRWGALCLAGRAYVQQLMGSGANIQELFEQYVVFGDASLAVRSRASRALTVDGPQVVPVGGFDASFTVTDDVGLPVAGAALHLVKGDELELLGFTDAAGQVDLLIGAATPGLISMTVTAFDATPATGTIDVVVTGCGVVKASAQVIPCAGGIEVTLWDQDLNLSPDAVDAAEVTIAWGQGASLPLALTETGVDSDRFMGALTAEDFSPALAHGDAPVVTYADADCDGAAATSEAMVAVDCLPPAISDVTAADVVATGATITWSTDEPARGRIILTGPTGPVTVDAPLLLEAQAITVGDLTPSTTYSFTIEARDVVDNAALDDNGGQGYGFTTPACTPDCTSKNCGDDGCGGSCGVCDAEQTCNADGVCFGGPGCEPGWTAGCGGCKCEACVCEADPYCCDTAWDELCVDLCLSACGGCGSCTASCEGKDCGDDGCGGDCGACPDEAPYCGPDYLCSDVCTPSCAGQACGDDGCGGSCGDCPEGQACEDGACVADMGICGPKEIAGCPGCSCEACVCELDPFCCENQWDELCAEACMQSCGGCAPCEPDCAGKVCGDDGCGGACGGCPPDEPYCSSGQCTSCEPQCDGKTCGDDGCSGQCGTCAEGEICEGDHCACPPSCTMEDGGLKECGDDGCGGTCGTCDGAYVCSPEFTCVHFTGCEAHEGAGCDGCLCEDCVCGEDAFCCEETWDDSCVALCQDTCGGCGAPCYPSCPGGFCGEDGCGGTCACPGAQDACVEGACVCQPACTDRECGADGCEGYCGFCPQGEVCREDGTCGESLVEPRVDTVQPEGDVEETSEEVNGGGGGQRGGGGGGCSLDQRGGASGLGWLGMLLLVLSSSARRSRKEQALHR